MGCDMRDFRDSKAMAQSLRRALSDRSIKLTHSDCLALISKSFGLDNWNVLAAKIEAAAPAAALEQVQAAEKKTCYCSFCGKSQHEVATLIAGPNVFVCNECVGLCDGILLDKSLTREIEAAKARDPARDPLDVTLELLRAYGDDQLRTCLRSGQDWLKHIEWSIAQMTEALDRPPGAAKLGGRARDPLAGKSRDEIETQRATFERQQIEVRQRLTLVNRALEERASSPLPS
jgi:hypothetical protein